MHVEQLRIALNFWSYFLKLLVNYRYIEAVVLHPAAKFQTAVVSCLKQIKDYKFQ